jgi:benzoate membrane transport protein
MEKGPGIASAFQDMRKFLTVAAFGNAIIAWYFWATKTIIMLDVGAKAHLSQDVIISWIFVIHLLNGIFTLFLVLYYKQPCIVAGVIPLYPMMLAAMKFISFPEVMGAFLMAGVIIIVLSISGAMRKIVEFLPAPIVMGMVASVLLPYGMSVVKLGAISTTVWGFTLGSYLVMMAIPKASRKVPPALVALIVGLIGVTLSHNATWGNMYITAPHLKFVMPVLSVSGFLQMTIPAVILIVGMNTLQAAATMMAEGYEPPVTAMTLIPAIGTLVGSFFCSPPPCPAGPTTAIAAARASGEDPRGRYVSAFITSVLQILFSLSIVGLLALEKVVPAAFIELVAGLAMLDVILSCFRHAFSSKFKFGALFAFVITATALSSKPIQFFSIGPAFWGLVGGLIVSLLVDRGDFAAQKEMQKGKQTAGAHA